MLRGFGVHRRIDRPLHLRHEQRRLALDVRLAPAEPVALRAVQLGHESLQVAAVGEQLGVAAAGLTQNRQLRRKQADEGRGMVAQLRAVQLVRAGESSVRADRRHVTLRDRLGVVR